MPNDTSDQKKKSGKFNLQNQKGSIQPKEELAPHEKADVDMSNISAVKSQELYQWYCEVQQKLNKVKLTNNKIEGDILRRHERYIDREKGYRKELDDLQRKLRIRQGYEHDALSKNKNVIK